MSQTAVCEELVRMVLERATERIYPSREALENALRSGRRLRVYCGVDPTGPHLHLGHLTNLLCLKWLQELGHEIVFLIGDFTARIGDPTDKLAARRSLSEEEIKENYSTFRIQAGRIVRFSGKNPAKVKFNSAWLCRMTLTDVIRLAQHATVQQMIERDMFVERLRAKKPVGLHEFLYPLLQGYDSVAMDIDLEIGGTDQTFNMLVGRTLMRAYRGKEKFVLTTKLLVHPETGKKLMHKSEGGLINLDDSSEDIFGKVMALDDVSMFPVAELCTEMPEEEIKELQRAVSVHEINPRDAKIEIARAVTATVYGSGAAKKAKKQFERLFSKKEVSGELPVLALPSIKILATDVVLKSGVVKSKSEARRLVAQGGLKIKGSVVRDPYATFTLQRGDVVKIGKRHFFRVSK